MTSPVVSVIIPCYNAEKNLVQCMDSICRQTLDQIEIICIDDGSSDSTLELLQNYQEKDSRVRVIQQKNAGAGAARNVGLDCAAGKYLSFLDADDFFEPDMLERAVAAAETWQADYIVFRANRYYPAQDRYEEMPWAVRSSDLPPYMPFSYRELTGNVFLSFVGWAWDKLFLRSFVQEHHLRFQEQRTTNDMLFVFSALICARRIAVVQDVLAHQRRGESDTLSVTREKSWHCFYDALMALRERLIQENVFWELEKDFINYSLHFSLWNLNSLAEPSHTLLEQKLCSEWFDELGISDKPKAYFWNSREYAQYLKIRKCGSKTGQNEVPENIEQDEPASEGLPITLSLDKLTTPETIYAVNIAFDRLRDRLMVNQKEWERYQRWYWKYKFHCYRRVYEQLADPIKKEYQNRMGQEFKRAIQLQQIQKKDFAGEEWYEIRKMILFSELAGNNLWEKIRRRLNRCFSIG